MVITDTEKVCDLVTLNQAFPYIFLQIFKRKGWLK
jgi:hypothetical protein